jgi:hypothetical protein
VILYANGCSNTAADEAVVPNVFASANAITTIDRRPHPKNLEASWCTVLAKHLKYELVCEAESASSNDRILRTTTSWINNNLDRLDQTFIAIQWTTWEREEWLHEGVYYQVNSSGYDRVPPELKQRYKNYVISHDYRQKTLEWHEKIWQFHCWLNQLNVPHIMYNGWSTFSYMPDRKDWNNQYLGPYDKNLSYNSVLVNNGFKWATPNRYHFRADGHCFWAKYLLQYIIDNKLLQSSK